MNAREEIHGLSRANVDMLERSAARAFLGCGISLLAGAVWLLTGPVAKADVVTDWNVTAVDKSLPCINIARTSPLLAALFGPHAMADLSPECAPKRPFAVTSKFMGSRPWTVTVIRGASTQCGPHRRARKLVIYACTVVQRGPL